eukprot:435208-Pyramimonas_sp.AAC.1
MSLLPALPPNVATPSKRRAHDVVLQCDESGGSSALRMRPPRSGSCCAAPPGVRDGAPSEVRRHGPGLPGRAGAIGPLSAI